jgi:glucose-6-phosphate isomerase
MRNSNAPPVVTTSLALDTSKFLDGGVEASAVSALSPRLDGLRAKLRRWQSAGASSFLALPFNADIAAIQERARAIGARQARTVVFGTGGSSLGGEMLVRVLGRGHHPVVFYDNIDHLGFAELRHTDWTSTQLLVISKSGNTAETLCQFLAVLPQLEAQLGNSGVRERVQIITENPTGALAQLARELNLETVAHPPVGGRYSVLSVVGLLPAAIADVDIAALLMGARAMAESCAANDIEQNPAFWNGAAQYLHAERGRTQSVQMVYGDRFRPISRWFRQLCAESLGKADAEGRARGVTPIEAHGVTDQHSQLQLYLDGPDDKLFSFITSNEQRALGEPIPRRFAHIADVAPLVGHTTGELFMAEFEAIRTSLSQRQRPQRTFYLGLDDAAALGELIVLLELETVVVAELMGVDPFDQPAVEQGKILAREYLNKQ